MFLSPTAIIITSRITSSTAGGGGSSSGFSLTGLQFRCYSRLD